MAFRVWCFLWIFTRQNTNLHNYYPETEHLIIGSIASTLKGFLRLACGLGTRTLKPNPVAFRVAKVSANGASGVICGHHEGDVVLLPQGFRTLGLRMFRV